MKKSLEKMAKRYGLPEKATRGELEKKFPMALRTKSLLMVIGKDGRDKESPYFAACYEFTSEFHEETDWGQDAEMEIRGITENRFPMDGDAARAILFAYEYWTSNVW